MSLRFFCIFLIHTSFTAGVFFETTRRILCPTVWNTKTTVWDIYFTLWNTNPAV